MPIIKHNYLVTDGRRHPAVIAEAFHIAGTGRPGPVLVDIPKDALQAPADVQLAGRARPARLPAGDPAARQADPRGRAADGRAERPVLYVGGGVIRAGAAAEVLRKLAELTGIPVVTTLMARGAFPDSHPQHLGMPGMHGTVAAVTALQKSDLIVALGARFDDRVTGKLDLFAPTPRSSTPTSTRPRSARTGGPTCRSWATQGRSSPS